MHHLRWMRHGSVEIQPAQKASCAVDGCDNWAKGRGWCAKHYARWRTYGDPLGAAVWMPRDEETAFRERVDMTGECWTWKLRPTDKGYGRWTINGRTVYAHVWAYEYYRGPVPPGLELDHLCRNTLCANPDHLEAVTHHENVLRGRAGQPQAAVVMCPQGHAYDEMNTYRARDGSRGCKECRREQVRQSRLRRRLARA